MSEFLTPTDIGNRALQHCGAEMMDSVLGFTEVSKVAKQVSFVYGKERRAELRRNVWRFAKRRTVLRAIDTTAMLLAPAIWVSTTTYFAGSIVSDASGTFWISRTGNNLNNQPQVSNSWEPYFGPMTVPRYDPKQAYSSGEVVYTAAGDGTYNTYLSLVGANSLHPALPNQWISTTTYFQNQVVQEFPAWAGGTTYAAGATVTYLSTVYTSLVSGNIGQTPSTSANWVLTPTLTLSVGQPQTSPITEWSQTTAYNLGDFAIFNGSVYVSIAGSNSGNFPNAAGSTSWAKQTGGTLYMSLIDINFGNDPSTAPALWAVGTTYAAGSKVGGSNGIIYSSVGNGNIGHDPTIDNGTNWTNTGVLNPWTTVFSQGGGNDQWMQIGGASFPSGIALSDLNIVYPIGAGPASQTTTKNVYRLPAGYLRQAPQDPKAGSNSILGAPAGLPYNDWNLEGDYLISAEAGPIIFAFVADFQDVTRMDDMFCEGLAARIAMAVCEPLTQSTAKLGVIVKIYDRVMGEARTVNGIETGPTEPPLDDFIACRA